MNNRPELPMLWAEWALPEDIGDADVFIPENPAYPEQSANQYTTGWYVSPGDPLVKQPHQWINAWYQAVDWQLQRWGQESFGWSPEIEYPQYAIAHEAGKRYIAKQANIGKQPSTSPSDWVEAAFAEASEAYAAYQALSASWTAHIQSRSDPHDVHAHQFGGSTKSEIDTQVATQQSAVDSHEARRDDPHKVTPAQAGTLPATGGTFTGPVEMVIMQLGLGRQGAQVRMTGQGFELFADPTRFGINVSTREAALNGEVMLRLGNYRALRQRNAWKFRVPEADIHFPLASDLHMRSSMFNGPTYTANAGITYTNCAGVAATTAANEPGFGRGGLQIRPGFAQVLPMPAGTSTIVGTVFGILDGVPVVGMGPLTQTNILEFFPPGLELKDVRIWFYRLTAYQVAALGVK